MVAEQSALTIQLRPGADTGADELTDMAHRLRDELLELDVDTVELAGTGEAPAGAKGIGLLTIGGLVVRFALQTEVLRTVVNGVQSWLSRQRLHSVKLVLDGDTLEVTGVSSAEQADLIDVFIARHADPGH